MKAGFGQSEQTIRVQHEKSRPAFVNSSHPVVQSLQKLLQDSKTGTRKQELSGNIEEK